MFNTKDCYIQILVVHAEARSRLGQNFHPNGLFFAERLDADVDPGMNKACYADFEELNGILCVGFCICRTRKLVSDRLERASVDEVANPGIKGGFWLRTNLFGVRALTETSSNFLMTYVTGGPG